MKQFGGLVIGGADKVMRKAESKSLKKLKLKRKSKTKSLKQIFLMYLLKFCIGVILTIFLLIAILMVGLQFGWIIPANYVENVLNESAEYLKEYDSYEWIPKSCEYAVYTVRGELKEYTGSKEHAVQSWKDYEEGFRSRGRFYYYVIENEEEICIVRYRVLPAYNNERLNQMLPNPFFCFVLVFMVLFLVEAITLANRYTKKVTKELNVVKTVTENIQMNQLDFSMDFTQIQELNEILDSLNHMKEELKTSLRSQWNLEEMKKRQIQALGHDIKTPLTILYGNAELLEETELDEEQNSYQEKIVTSAEEIETYLNELLELSRSEHKENLNICKFEFEPFFEEVRKEVDVLLQKKCVHLNVRKERVIGSFLGDEFALKRVLMNILRNSIEAVNENGTIRITVDLYSKLQESKQGPLHSRELLILVEDSGRGFDEEELKRATEQFYQGDDSRSSKQHYGLGLYIVKNLVENHGGSLNLSNSDSLGGAKVEVRLPMEGKEN